MPDCALIEGNVSKSCLAAGAATLQTQKAAMEMVKEYCLRREEVDLNCTALHFTDIPTQDLTRWAIATSYQQQAAAHFTCTQICSSWCCLSGMNQQIQSDRNCRALELLVIDGVLQKATSKTYKVQYFIWQVKATLMWCHDLSTLQIYLGRQYYEETEKVGQGQSNSLPYAEWR